MTPFVLDQEDECVHTARDLDEALSVGIVVGGMVSLVISGIAVALMIW